MSRLEYYNRPLVAFNPENKEHRRFYHRFLVDNSWGTCPVRFICPTESGMDLVKMIQNQMIQFYVWREFAEEKPKTLPRGRKIVGLTSGGFGVTIDA